MQCGVISNIFSPGGFTSGWFIPANGEPQDTENPDGTPLTANFNFFAVDELLDQKEEVIDRLRLLVIGTEKASPSSKFDMILHSGCARKRSTKSKALESKKTKEEDVILSSHPKSLADNPTLTSVVFATSRSEDLLPTVIVSEPSDDVICVQLPAEDAIDGYDGTSFFAQGDAFSEMTQRVLFDGLHRQRTISLAESGVLGAEDMEDHAGLIVIDEGMGDEHPSG
ncbi:hypothetical protein J6590_034015 [Homalodisca vitripennis]|nr:hypothetical protein J6590_034015 [Homalodisca vitripennis]